MERTECLKDTYLTLSGLLDDFKKKNDKANVGALKHMDGIFVRNIVIPVRKKLAHNYINNFFFFEILGVHPNFVQNKISSRELSSFILGFCDKCRNRYHIDEIEKCFESYQLEGKATAKIYLREPDDRKDLEDSDDKSEKAKTKKRTYRSTGYITEEFRYVELNMKFVLDKIAQFLINAMRKYWTSVMENSSENVRIDTYCDFFVSLTIYEIFLRKFEKKLQGEYMKYEMYMRGVKSAWRILNDESASLETKEKAFCYISLYDKSQFQVVEEVNNHTALYAAAIQCVALVELINTQSYYYEHRELMILEKIPFPEGLYFEKNGNESYWIKKMVNEFVNTLKENDFFVNLPLHRNHETVKKIFEFMDYILQHKDVTFYVLPTEDDHAEESEFLEMVRNIGFPLLERNSQIMEIREDGN